MEAVIGKDTVRRFLERPPLATITPQNYTENTLVLEVTEYSGTTLESEYEKFSVTAQTESGTTTNWYITGEGKLSNTQ